MNFRDYFPLGRAHGLAFCNREAETEWLSNNIKSVKHCLLVAPRRFGKTSLAEHAIEKTKLPYVHLNFNTCTTEADIDKVIRRGVGILVGKALGPVDTLMQSVKRYIKHFTPKIVVETEFAFLELSAQSSSSPVANIEESLNLMEKLLQEKGKQAVLLLDEFQAVGLISEGSGVEAVIRNVAQNMKHLSIVFSGSQRRLLQQMFEDSNRPLYKLCRKLHLNRMEASHYHKYINHVAQLTWKKPLSEEAFEKIMFLSERHPYYVNYLCDIIWAENTKSPSLKDIEHAFISMVEEERSDAQTELSNLSMGQKKVLKHIAKPESDGLYSTKAIATIGIAQSTASAAVKVLLKKDIIEIEGEHYKIINPIIKWLLLENEA